jgi:hypothetical protein
MILKFHQGLTLERWKAMPWDKKILNLVSELSRVKNWIKEDENLCADEAIERALELIDMTVEVGIHEKTVFFWKEFLRFRELLAGFYRQSKKNQEAFKILTQTFIELDPMLHNMGIKI